MGDDGANFNDNLDVDCDDDDDGVNVRIAHLRIAPWWAILSTSFIRIAHPNYNISLVSLAIVF